MDLALAEDAYRDGDYAGAAILLAEVAATATGDARSRALLGQARAEIAADDATAGLATIRTLLKERPDPETVLAARFLRARAHLMSHAYDAAATDFVAYAEADGVAAIYAREDAATAFAYAGDEMAARRELQLAIDSDPSERQLRIMLLALGQSFERSELWTDAAATFERFDAVSDSNADHALALLHLGEIDRERGDPAGWEERLTRVIALYPETSAASAALDELNEAGRPPSGVLAGTVYYKSFRDDEALAVLTDYLDSAAPGPDAAQAAYYRATALERLGRLSEAIEGYDQADAYAPAGPFAHKAVWWGAVNADLVGDYAGALRRYEALLGRFPTSSFAAEAGFRIALTYYRSGEYATAAERWRQEAAIRSGEPRARALLWQGRALSELGDAPGAAETWQAATGEPDGDYYGLRAEALLKEYPREPALSGWPPEEPSVPEAPDWDAIETWVAGWAGSPASAFDVAASEAWQRALALRELGEERRSSDELRGLLDAHDTEPWDLVGLVRGFHEARLVHLAAIGAARLYLQAPASLRDSIPRDLYRLSFPLDYLPIAREVAREYGVPVLLLYALIRQESFFDPQAVSSANAIGLTQVIPSTGEEIAQRLGVEGFSPEMLTRPELSLRFGAYYIGARLRDFGGSPYFALAAYNAGAGNASRWSKDGTLTDLDLYLEEIDLDEPKRYVRYVLQNYARYRWLYAGLDHPTLLPADSTR